MNKYGKLIAERKNFHEDEPVFVLRGKDLLAPAAVEMYANLLRAAAAGVYRGADYGAVAAEGDQMLSMAQDVSNTAASMIVWQAENPGRVRLPD